MALPWLKSVNALADTPKAEDFPKRFGRGFPGLRRSMRTIGAPRGTGADMKLSKSLTPLEPFKQKINVIDGLYVKALTPGKGIHPAQTGSILSGVHDHQGRPDPFRRQRRSDDRQPGGTDTPQSSIVLGCDQPNHGLSRDQFLDGLQFLHLVAVAGISTVPLELYPALAWDNLFDNHGSLLNLSVLDRVKDRAADPVSRKIDAGDRDKLDEYLTSVREVEKRVEIMRKSL